MQHASARSSVRSFSPRLVTALVLVAALGLGTSVAAQRTWIVDAGNGAGADFTDLPPAFAAVADGDRVLVRSGSYTAGRLDKAVRLVADAGAVVMMVRTDTTTTV